MPSNSMTGSTAAAQLQPILCWKYLYKIVSNISITHYQWKIKYLHCFNGFVNFLLLFNSFSK